MKVFYTPGRPEGGGGKRDNLSRAPGLRGPRKARKKKTHSCNLRVFLVNKTLEKPHWRNVCVGVWGEGVG